MWIVTNYDHDAIEESLQRVCDRSKAKMNAHAIRFVDTADLPGMLASSNR